MPAALSRTSALSLILALAPAALLVFFLGGVDPRAHAAVALCELAAFFMLVADRVRARRHLRTSLLGAPLLFGVATALLALVPVPLVIIGVVDHDAADRLARIRGLLPPDSVGLVRSVLAFDPPEAALTCLRLGAALLCFAVVSHVAVHRGGRRIAYGVLAGAGAVSFLIAFGHAVANIPRVWGVYGGAAATFHAPLANANHDGKLFTFFALLCVGRALSIRRGIEAIVLAGIGMACAVGVLLCDSRGSYLALCAGAFFFVVARWRSVATVAAAGGLALASMAFTVGVSLVARFAAFDPEGMRKSKVIILPHAWDVAGDHAAGLGPGAFGVVLPSRLVVGDLDASRFVYTHVENIVLQVLVDHGFLLGAILLVGVIVLAWRTGRAGALGVAPAASAALAALLVGETLDFFTETPLGLLLAAIAAALIAARSPEAMRGPSLHQRGAVVAALATTLVTALVMPVALADWRHAIDVELQRTPLAKRRPLLLRAVARHPSDAQYAYQLAVDARLKRNPHDALQWVNRSVALWPSHRRAHIEAARAFIGLHRVDQALLEYRVAWRCGGEDPALTAEVIERLPSVELLRRAVPEDAKALVAMSKSLRRLDHPRLDDAQIFLDAAAAVPGADPTLTASALQLAIERRDVDGASSRAVIAMQAPRPAGETAVAAAEAMAQKDGASAAFDLSTPWLARVSNPAPLLQWRLRTAMEIGRDVDADAALAELRRNAHGAAALFDVEELYSEVLERRGRIAEAKSVVERMLEQHPRDKALFERRAKLESRLAAEGLSHPKRR